MGITIVGLGPGSGHFLTREAWDLLAAIKQRLFANQPPSGS